MCKLGAFGQFYCIIYMIHHMMICLFLGQKTMPSNFGVLNMYARSDYTNLRHFPMPVGMGRATVVSDLC